MVVITAIMEKTVKNTGGVAALQKMPKKFRKYKAVCDRLLGKDVLIVICVGEDVACIGTDRDDGAVVLACKSNKSHDQLARYTLSFKAFEDTRMVDDHPFRGWPLIR